jgi:3'-5' exoribonuclease
MKSQFVEELKAGQAVKEKFILSKKILKEKKDGGFFSLAEFSDRTGTIEGIAWDNASDEVQAIPTGEFVYVSGNVNEYNDRLQIVVQAINRLSDDEINSEDFLPGPDEDINAVMTEITEAVKHVQNPNLRKLLDLFFGDMFFISLFRQAPAAKRAHHAHLGGLAIHTRTVVKQVSLIQETYSFVNKDLLVTGALLHDVGKIHEYTYHKKIDISTRGRLVGHIVIGYDMVKEKIDKIPHFPEDLKLKVLHMILSHHGELEYGSPKLPSFPEAIILHFIDNLDSKVEMMNDAIRRNRGIEKEWSDYHPFLEREIYLKEEE